MECSKAYANALRCEIALSDFNSWTSDVCFVTLKTSPPGEMSLCHTYLAMCARKCSEYSDHYHINALQSSWTGQRINLI